MQHGRRLLLQQGGYNDWSGQMSGRIDVAHQQQHQAMMASMHKASMTHQDVWQLGNNMQQVVDNAKCTLKHLVTKTLIPLQTQIPERLLSLPNIVHVLRLY